ncbi:MAG TPA: EamA family transporter [Actinomycetota bacterium]|nr:EamA family transporter [Actinomycetota bacterium]
MAILLSLLAAATYGAADFVGGYVTKRAHVLAVVFLSQAFGTIPFLIAFPLINDAGFSRAALAWGAAAGVGGATGVILLYAGLAAGRMSVVAPITAVEAACVPVIFGLIRGERPGAIALMGIVVAVIAVGLISAAPEPAPPGQPHVRQGRLPAGVPHALGAGAAFGAFFIFLDHAGDYAGLWPLVGARIASLSIAGTAILVSIRTLRVPRGTGRAIAGAGALDFTANVFYLLASRAGLLSLVAVITSMYPASTVLLARIVLKERLVATQLAGLACAVAGVIMIATG